MINMILLLSLILFLLLYLIGKKRGIKAFCSLFINYFLIVAAIWLICRGVSPIAVAVVFSLGASAFILFFLNGVNIKTEVAYAAVVLVLLITAAFVIFVVYRGNLNGFSQENGEIVFIYPGDIAVNYYQAAVAVILIGLTGAIADTALDIATSLNEVYKNNPDSSFADLLKSGENIGGDVLGTMINTLFFVFVGEFIGFFVFHFAVMRNQDILMIINNKLFAQEVSKLLIGSLGCTLIIPITIFVQGLGYNRRKTAK